MHKKTQKIILMAKACLLLAFLASCSKKSELPAYIPQGALAVGTVDAATLAGKIALDKLGSTEWNDLWDLSERPGKPAPVPGSEEYKWKQLLKNPSQLGIAFFEDIYAYIGEMKGEELGYAGLLLKLNDKSQLEAYLAGDAPAFFQGNTETKGDVSCRVSPDSKGAVAWNSNALLILYAPNAGVDLAAEAYYSLQLKKEQSMQGKESFEAFNKQGKDIGIFVNAKELLTHLPAKRLPPYLLGASIDYLALSANFSDGEVELLTQQYLHTSKAKDVEGLFAEVSHKDWLERFDIPPSLGYANFRYTSAWLKEFVVNQYSQEQFNMYLSGIGLSEHNFLSIFKGNMMVACTGTGKVTREVITYEMDAEFNMKEIKAMEEVDAPMFLAVMDVDEAGMRDLLQKLSKLAMVAEDNEGFKVTHQNYKDDGWKIFLKDGKAILTNQPQLMTSGETFSSDLLQAAQESPMSGYINIEGVMTSFPLLAGLGGKEVAKHFKSIDMQANSGGKSLIETKMKVQLQERDRNAFLTIVGILKNTEIPTSQPVQ